MYSNILVAEGSFHILTKINLMLYILMFVLISWVFEIQTQSCTLKISHQLVTIVNFCPALQRD